MDYVQLKLVPLQLIWSNSRRKLVYSVSMKKSIGRNLKKKRVWYSILSSIENLKQAFQPKKAVQGFFGYQETKIRKLFVISAAYPIVQPMSHSPQELKSRKLNPKISILLQYSNVLFLRDQQTDWFSSKPMYQELKKPQSSLVSRK